MKISRRLSEICQTISVNEFQHIWDCCCDHGYLGEQLMADHPNSQVHFVDVVPHLIDDIDQRLSTQAHTNWASHCMDAADIKLTAVQSNLVIIAGVGGDLLIDMVASIVGNNAEVLSHSRLDFILCPVRQLHKVREELNTLKLGLVREKIVHENNQFYEVIRVSNQSNTQLSLVGDSMWDPSNSQHIKYRNAMICHYEKQPSEQSQKLLHMYKKSI